MTDMSFVTPQGSASGISVFVPILDTFFEYVFLKYYRPELILSRYLTRIKNAVIQHDCIASFIKKISQWIELWAALPLANTMDPRLHALPDETQRFIISQIKRRAELCSSIVDRERLPLQRSEQQRKEQQNAAGDSSQEQGRLLLLQAYYVGPGELREEGPRHDNDFVRIQDIKVAPTAEELLCHVPPFLPANIPNAPHPLPLDSMGRVMDIQFRLLREELL